MGTAACSRTWWFFRATTFFLSFSVFFAEYYFFTAPGICLGVAFVPMLQMKPETPIFLLGMPAVGKTTLGRGVAQRLGCDFFDTDQRIAQQADLSVASFIARYGETAFRGRERQQIRTLAARRGGCLVATGGGTPLFYDNASLMHKAGITIWLHDELPNICRRINERMPAYRHLFFPPHEQMQALPRITQDQVAALLDKRAPCYAQAQHKFLLAAGPVSASVKTLCAYVLGITQGIPKRVHEGGQ